MSVLSPAFSSRHTPTDPSCTVRGSWSHLGPLRSRIVPGRRRGRACRTCAENREVLRLLAELRDARPILDRERFFRCSLCPTLIRVPAGQSPQAVAVQHHTDEHRRGQE